MSCKIVATPDFARALKRLAKRYKSLKDDYSAFLSALEENPQMGTELGKNLRKVRFAFKSKGKGKSGGARVITHTVVLETDGTDVTLVIIYDKAEQENITDKELRLLMRKNGLV